MTIKTFIEKAIKGGWEFDYCVPYFDEVGNLCIGRDIKNIDIEYVISIHEILLDPKAWEAVGKTEGWERKQKGWICVNCSRKWSKKYGCELCDNTAGEQNFEGENFKDKMHQMINSLIDGNSPEDFIKTL